MKVGDSILCPHCGRDSFLRKESIMDGFRKTGEVLKCASCGVEIESVSIEKKESASVSTAEKGKALLDLLGESDFVANKNVLEGTERRFCRDCVHRVMNAFRIHCSLHDRNVNSMDDCDDFKKRAAEE